MTTPYVNTTIVVLWIISAGAFATLVPVTTLSLWCMLGVLATTPPLIFLHYWKRPAQRVDLTVAPRPDRRAFRQTP